MLDLLQKIKRPLTEPEVKEKKKVLPEIKTLVEFKEKLSVVPGMILETAEFRREYRFCRENKNWQIMILFFDEPLCIYENSLQQAYDRIKRELL